MFSHSGHELRRRVKLSAMRIGFGDFVLDEERRELLRGDAPLHVSPKALTLLQTLINAAPAALSKEELYRHVWGSTIVDEANLPNLVGELRSALGDDSRDARYIRTLHRFGYRFDAPLTVLCETHAAPAPTRSWLVFPSREYPLRLGENVIGRDADAEVFLDSGKVSRQHARITLANGSAILEDLGSKNGTFVEGERVTAGVELHDGDIVGLGSLKLTFHTNVDAETTVTDTNLKA